MNLRNLLLSSAAALLCTASMSAQLSHTWVSGSGNDNNNCSFTAPCATFQGALANTSTGGMITAKDAGDFGTVGTAQSVTIDGANMGSISLYKYVTAAVFIENAAHVTLQNITINGLTQGDYGIYVLGGGSVIIDNCKIMGFGTGGIYYDGAGRLTVENSRIETLTGSQAFGIWIQNDAVENVFVKNTVIDASPLANNNYGFFVQQASGTLNASLQNVSILGAGYGAVSTYAGVTQITGSVLSQSRVGVIANSGAIVSVATSLITSNTTGVCSNASSKVRLDNNDIYDNTTAIANCGGIVKTSTTNKTSGTISIPVSDVSESVTF